VDPHSFEEELGSICRCDILLAGSEDGHLRKPINDHKYAVISLLGGWKARHVWKAIHLLTPFSHVLHLLISLLVLRLGLVVLRGAISTWSLVMWVGAAFALLQL
jgi:hypothetical protein